LGLFFNSKLVVATAAGAGLVSVPLYIAEIAPVQIRGALVGIVAWAVVLGNLLSACVMYGVSDKIGQIVWLLPVSYEAG
jgi:MFS family permease